MKVEFVKFYEISRDDKGQQLTGTLHIRLPEIGINIKGINVLRKKAYWFICLPNRKGYDHSLGQQISYGLFLFEEKEKNAELLQILRRDGRKFVEGYLESNAPITSEEKRVSHFTPPERPKKSAAAESVQDKKEAGVSGIVKKIASKEWTDPPPRKEARARTVSKFARR